MMATVSNLSEGWCNVQREVVDDATIKQLGERLEKLRLYIERFTEDNPSTVAFEYAYSADKIADFEKLEKAVKAVFELDRLGNTNSEMRANAYKKLGEMIQNVEAVFNNDLTRLNENLHAFAYQQGKTRYGLNANLELVKLGKRRKLAEKFGKKLPEEAYFIDILGEMSFRLTSRFNDREMVLTSLEKRVLMVTEDALKRLNTSTKEKIRGVENGG